MATGDHQRPHEVVHCETTVIIAKGGQDRQTAWDHRTIVKVLARRGAALIKSSGMRRKCSRSRKIARRTEHKRGTNAQGVLRE